MSTGLKVLFVQLEVGLIMPELSWAPDRMLWVYYNRKLHYLVQCNWKKVYPPLH